MRNALRVLLVAAATVLSLASATQPQYQNPPPAGTQPGTTMSGGPGGPAGPAGTCESACGHYYQCKGSSDQVAFQDCVARCMQQRPDPAGLGQYAQTDCATAISLMEGSAPPPGTTMGGGGAPTNMGGGPGGGGAVAGGACRAYAGEGADPQMFQLLLKNPWCSIGQPAQSRVVFSSQTGSVSVSTGQSFCWRLQGTGLVVSQDGGATWGAATPITVQYDAQGYPTLNANGVRYAGCN